MKRVIAFVILAIVLADAGCGGDAVLATFVWPKATTTRLVLYSSGRYEQWLVADGVPERPFRKSLAYHLHSGWIEARVQREPIEMGTYLRSSTNLVITVKQDARHSPDWPTKRVYRIMAHDDIEYLFDERGGWAAKYEESKDINVLLYAWRQERR